MALRNSILLFNRIMHDLLWLTAVSGLRKWVLVLVQAFLVLKLCSVFCFIRQLILQLCSSAVFNVSGNSTATTRPAAAQKIHHSRSFWARGWGQWCWWYSNGGRWSAPRQNASWSTGYWKHTLVFDNTCMEYSLLYRWKLWKRLLTPQ